MSSIALFAPAKLNLFLAITGKRSDGYHNLLSLTVKLDFGDELWLEEDASGKITLEADDPTLPTGENNLICKAAAAYGEASGDDNGCRFTLRKRIPTGAGLGGGSSDAAAALVGLNTRGGQRLGPERLAELASKIGSDCPLFLRPGAVVMRGRGERLSDVTASAQSRLAGRRVCVFKPSFDIATAWAYQQMAARQKAPYLSETLAEENLKTWLDTPTLRAEELLFNNMEAVAFEKYVGLPTLLEDLRTEFSLSVGMSGSGSACFALLPDNFPSAGLVARIREAWGSECFLKEASIR